MAMKKWCLECARDGRNEQATAQVDGDPLCAAHAKEAAAFVLPAPSEDAQLPSLKGRRRVLWRARLIHQQKKDEFLFRSTEDFNEAAALATDLLCGEPGDAKAGAVIVGIERVALLWN